MYPDGWWIEPRDRPPPIKPDWRKVILFLAASGIVVTIALAISALIR